MITSESLIELNLKSKNKSEIIENLAQRAKKLGYVSDLAGYLEAVYAQEKLFPTVIGYDVAMPYGKSSCVEKSFIAFARSDKPFQWDSRVDLGARLIFLIGVPEWQEVDLNFKLLSHMSGGVTNEYYRERLSEAADAAEVAAIFKRMRL